MAGDYSSSMRGASEQKKCTAMICGRLLALVHLAEYESYSLLCGFRGSGYLPRVQIVLDFAGSADYTSLQISIPQMGRLARAAPGDGGYRAPAENEGYTNTCS